MEDRFKFRAGITEIYSYSNKDEEEKTVSFILDNVGISYSGAYITFHQDDVYKALQDKGLSDENIEEIIDSMQDNNSNSADNEYFIWEYYDYIEQCTGLRDKNGNLIYEGDILDVPELCDAMVNVIYVNDLLINNRIGYYCKNLRTFSVKSFTNPDIDLSELEIIGNIHTYKGEEYELSKN